MKRESCRNRSQTTKQVLESFMVETSVYERVLNNVLDSIPIDTLYANAPDQEILVETSGFIYIVARGHGVLISPTMNPYHVPMKFITENKLKTGDFVTVKTSCKAVREIISIDGNSFCHEKPVRPSKGIIANKLNFKLGSRVAITSDRSFDFVEYMANSNLSDLYNIALLIDESDDCTDYLATNGFNEVYLTRVNFNTYKKIMYSLCSLFISKRHADKGKDVVLFIDNLNKLFKLYNASMFETESLDVTQLHTCSLSDLKSFFMEAKQTQGGGSLTIIMNIKEAQTELEKFVMDEFISLSNVLFDTHTGS